MDDGYLRFDCVGGIDRRVLIGKRVYVGPDRLCGVIGIKAYHLVDRDEEKKVPKIEDMYIDIGCTDRQEAEKAVNLGDCCTFYDSVVEFGQGYLKAKAIDDRVGCAAMIKLIESDLPCDTYFAFTVQEEVGTRGATVAAYSVQPEVALVLEGTTATDLPDIGEAKRICTAGDGVVIPFMDGGAIYDRGMYAMLSRIADENNIQWQTKHRIAGGTDARAVQRSLAGVRVGGIACAVRSIHSPASVGKISELEDMLKLAEQFMAEFASGGIC
jgi:endoglucanase